MEAYEASPDTADIALELPTGTGKTLIGLLIGEWRRRAHNERVLYLCPTRQLAHQVGAHAQKYGIKTEVCLAPDYDGLDAWQGGDALAISTYSSLFNFNPRFTAPQALVLDDAHAADGYVTSHWTVTIDRHEMEDAYQSLAALLEPVVDRRTAGLIGRDQLSSVDLSAVEMVPLPHWWPLAGDLEELITDGVDGTDEWYAWHHHVRGELSACCLLVSWQEIVLRPWIPTTKRQTQFANATQRIYMSATPGAGGELERIFGVKSIQRLPVPDEWERRSTGRRLFLMPAVSLGAAEREAVLTDAVERAGRALVLSPTRHAVEERRASLEEDGIATLGASDIEEDLSSFTSEDRAALVLANRYDGIDLPDEDCRLLIIDGLPVAVNILEQFLYQRLAAANILGERMRTRFTQGVGRCTRGEGDWCAVVVISQEAYDFCARGEVRSLLHPELQGELRYGLEESRDREPDDFLDLLEILLEHGEDWEGAEADIRELREQAVQAVDPAAAQLAEVVDDEVAFVYAMAAADYPRALEKAVAVSDGLGGDNAASYRAWWLYQAGCAAWLAHHRYGAPGMLERAQDLFGRAVGTGKAVYWFAELAYGNLGDATVLEVGQDDLEAAERIEAILRSLGFNGGLFKRETDQLIGRLKGVEPTPWEEGITELGQLLGFEAEHPDGQNAPDSVWVCSSRLAIVWEVKSKEGTEGSIGARTAQQVAGHSNWLRGNREIPDDAKVESILVSDRSRLGDGAGLHADDACVVSLDEVRELATRTIALLRRLRAQGRDGGDMEFRSAVIEALKSSDLLPSQLVPALTARRLETFSSA